MIVLKITLSYVLHLEKLTDSIFIPTKPAQIVAAAALVEFNQEVFVRFVNWPQRDLIRRIFIGAILTNEVRPGADRGPRAGSPRGVVVATGCVRFQESKLPGLLRRSLPLPVLTS